MIAMARSLLFLAWSTLRRQALSRKTALVLALFAMLLGLVLVVGLVGSRPGHPAWSAETLGHWVVLVLYLGFFVPIAALAYGIGALGDDRDEGSLVHLLARPLPRAGIYIAKFLAVVPLAVGVSLAGLAVLHFVAGSLVEGPIPLFSSFWPGTVLSSLAYLALFHLFAAAFRHSTAIAIGYAFFIEVVIAEMPGILKRVSIDFYTTCICLGTARPLGAVLPRERARTYLPIDADAAALVLVCLTAGFLVAGIFIFRGKEYREGI